MSAETVVGRALDRLLLNWDRALWSGRPAQQVVEIIVDALREDGLLVEDDRHLLDIRYGGLWSVQHPARCRPDLLDCEVHHWLANSPQSDAFDRDFDREMQRLLLLWMNEHPQQAEDVRAGSAALRLEVRLHEGFGLTFHLPEERG